MANTYEAKSLTGLKKENDNLLQQIGKRAVGLYRSKPTRFFDALWWFSVKSVMLIKASQGVHQVVLV